MDAGQPVAIVFDIAALRGRPSSAPTTTTACSSTRYRRRRGARASGRTTPPFARKTLPAEAWAPSARAAPAVAAPPARHGPPPARGTRSMRAHRRSEARPVRTVAVHCYPVAQESKLHPRGFVAPLLSRSAYHAVFTDVDKGVIDAINVEHSYGVHILDNADEDNEVEEIPTSKACFPPRTTLPRARIRVPQTAHRHHGRGPRRTRQDRPAARPWDRAP
ncbi:hypothetical protein B0H17DRAFT_458258 [Mycena rosella]|uniref:Uncharacterized protein n=1 Tax=Mycena rosella TaxID=1033263 RepID=A0AAD7FVN4_MYCRO|nr:hypothetical protein B0H17DRAFT_458258 [Mycena rosella]